jgi:hypothetical protein
MTQENGQFQEWMVLELFGHRRLFGLVTEVQIGGASFLRLDVPATLCEGDGWEATQFYSPSAVYAMTPITEDLARKMAQEYKPEPVTRWEVRALGSTVAPRL